MSHPDDSQPSLAGPAPDPDARTGGGGMVGSEHDHELAVVRQQIASALFPRVHGASAQKIGRFVVEHRLGAGAMGVVYAARDPALDRRVAIKLVRPEVGRDRKAQLRLEREARALAKLSHPNIVAIHEVGEHRGQVFLAMEHVRGQSLRAWQQRPGRSTAEVLAMYVQAGRGLAAAHAAGLVHRDFKPDNVLVDEGGRARVVDFGLVGGDQDARRAELARWEGSEATTELRLTTNTHAFLGTPAYMAPEQLDGGPVDARSDQFGFCVALYEALYGRHPFDASSLPALRKTVLGGHVSPPPARSPVPARLRRLLLQGLAVSPADRHPSLESLLDALARDPTAVRRRWLAVGALVLAASAGTYALASRDVPEGPPPCIGVEDELARTWNDERRATIAAAVRATGVSYAEPTLARVESALDDYAAAWTRMRSQACHARAEGLESDRQHDLRVACLERRRVAFETLVGVLAEPSRGDVENAVQAASALPRIDTCGDIEALAAAIPPPEDPDVARAVEAHRGTLARVHEYEVLGRYDEGRGLATVVVDSAEAKAYPPLEAEALLSLGAIELASQRYERATDMLSRTIEVALRAGHLDVAAEALARRIFTWGQLERFEDVEHDAPLARALVERSQDDQLRWLYLNNIGVAYMRRERYAEAKAALLEALEAKERAHGPRHFEYAVTLGNLVTVQTFLEEVEAARTNARRRREIFEQTIGSEHPFAVNAAFNDSTRAYHDGRFDAAHASMSSDVARMAEIFGELNEGLFTANLQLAPLANDRGAHAEALEHVDRALAVTRAHDLEQHGVRTWTFIHRAVALAGLGRHDEAMAELERGLEFAERGLNPWHDPADVLEHMAQVSLARGDVDASLAAARRALDLREQRPQPYPVQLSLARLEVAKALHAKGELDEALAMATLALEHFLATRPSVHLGLVDVYQALGDILLDLGRAEEALEQYETGHRGFARTAEPHNPKLAKLELGMARALLRVGGEDARAANRARAEALARGALASFRHYAPGFAKQAAAAERFLSQELGVSLAALE